MARRAREPFKGNGNQEIRFSAEVEELLIVNDGTNKLTFEAGYFSFTLGAGEVFDEEIDPFTVLKIVANGDYRGYVRDKY